MMSIIGDVVAGAIGGGGEAAGKVGFAQIQADIDEAKAARLMELQHQNAQTLQAKGFEHADTMQGKQFGHAETMQTKQFEHADTQQAKGFTHAETMQKGGFQHTEAMQAAQQAWQGEQNTMQRALTREQIVSHEKIAQANNRTALQVASIGGTVQQDKDGNMLFFDKSGKPTQIMDPNNPAQPLRGMKDLTPAAKAYSDVIKAQLVDLDKAEVAAATTGEPGAKQAIVDRRAKLNTELLNVLTGGIGEAGKAPPTPGKTGWDSSTGQVFKDGRVIGTAKSESDARKMTAGGKQEAKPGIVGARTVEPDAESKIPPKSLGQGRPNPAYTEFITNYGEPPAKFLGQGRPNPAYENWKNSVLAEQ